MKVNLFDKHINHPFKEIDEQGFYLGCLFPVYLLYPSAYKFRPEDDYHNELYIFENISKQFNKVERAINFGDVVIIKNFGNLHFSVFVERGKYAHMHRDRGFQYINIEKLIKRKVIGIYRWR